MRAKPNVTYAQILHGRVHWLFTENDLPEWADETDSPPPAFGIRAIEITGAVPAIGDLWDGTSFLPAPAPVAAPVLTPAPAQELQAADLASISALRELVLDLSGARPLTPAQRTAARAQLEAQETVAVAARVRLPIRTAE